MEEYERAQDRPKTDLGELPKFMAATTNFANGYLTITQALFKELPA